jgi:pyridoxal phosphate enzyme (YggS family)
MQRWGRLRVGFERCSTKCSVRPPVRGACRSLFVSSPRPRPYPLNGCVRRWTPAFDTWERIAFRRPCRKSTRWEREGVVWHFIGTLQRRKVKSVVGRFETIHSVDSLALAEEIDRQAKTAGLRQRILLEVNLAGEASKGGFEPTTLVAALESLNGFEHLDIRGLMAIPPPTPTAEDARPYFRQLRTLAQALTARGYRNINMQELSMGMSHDYPVAIEEGATYVRVGTAIFGARGE